MRILDWNSADLIKLHCLKGGWMRSASYWVLESALTSCAALIFAEKQFKGMFMTLHMTDMWRQKPARVSILTWNGINTRQICWLARLQIWSIYWDFTCHLNHEWKIAGKIFFRSCTQSAAFPSHPVTKKRYHKSAKLTCAGSQGAWNLHLSSQPYFDHPRAQ